MSEGRRVGLRGVGESRTMGDGVREEEWERGREGGRESR